MWANSVHALAGEKRRITFGAFVATLLAAFAWLVLRPHEPFYQGEPLSFWLQRPFPNGSYYFNQGFQYAAASPDAEKAVSALGAAAVPSLVKMVGTSETTGRRVAVMFARQYPFLHLPAQENAGEVAVWAFGILGPEAGSAIPALIGLLDNKNVTVRINAARALAALGPAAAPALPDLVTILNGSIGTGWQDIMLREAVAQALGAMGRAAVSALPRLAALSNEPAAQLAMIQIKGDSVAPFLETLRDTSDLMEWCRTARLVGTLGTNAEPAIPFLLAGLTASERTNRPPRNVVVQAALGTLARIHSRPDLCLPALLNLLDEGDPNVRYQALLVLRAFGPEAKPAVPGIVRCINNSPRWFWVQQEALNLLKTLDPQAVARIPLKQNP